MLNRLVGNHYQRLFRFRLKSTKQYEPVSPEEGELISVLPVREAVVDGDDVVHVEVADVEGVTEHVAVAVVANAGDALLGHGAAGAPAAALCGRQTRDLIWPAVARHWCERIPNSNINR